MLQCSIWKCKPFDANLSIARIYQGKKEDTKYAMINAETIRGQVIFIADDFESNSRNVGGVEFIPVMDESELITQFWEAAKHYDKVVTFNGRQFDIPFLYLRSAQLNIPISKKQKLI